MIFEGEDATGVTLDCNFATLSGEGTLKAGEDMIEVRSRKYTDTWQRPENITVRNCIVIGSVRVWGMGKNGQSPYLKESSRKPGPVRRVRNNAPTKIIFDNVTIIGLGRNPLYFSPGVTYSQLVNSEIKGNSEAVAVYLDAESAYNVIKNNYIYAETSREVMAIDGSSHNVIINNRFSGLDDGGIYLYRNCGEGGTIRHSTPSHNYIVNNIFYYDRYSGLNPSIYLGSRNGDTPGWGSYCEDDSGFNYGSSASDLDYATYNVVMQNQIYKRPISDMIRNTNWEVNSPNYIDHNETVTEETVETERLAGCYVANGYKKNFILDGESIDIFQFSDGEPTCLGYENTCNNGDLIFSISSSCAVSKSSFDCQVSENNNGCSEIASCPAGKKIIGATAACNLEYGTISTSTLATIHANHIEVIRASDNRSEGACYIGNNSVQEGQEMISGIDGLESVAVGCKEHDSNGGDCHITGILYCR